MFPFFRTVMEIPIIDIEDETGHEKLHKAFTTAGFAYIKDADILTTDILKHAKEFKKIK